MTLEKVLLVGCILTILSVLSSRVSGRLGVPALLTFLGIGMLAGSEGIGGIEMNDPGAAQSIAVVALVYILFGGGLQTRWQDARTVVGPALALATVGVVGTALAMGLFSWLVLGFDPLTGFLLGSIVSSTDAAAVFAVFAGKGVRLTGRLRPLLEFESGSNDPMAVFLTTGFIGLMLSPESSLLSLAPAFVVEMSLGLVLGYAIGRVATWSLNRIRMDVEGLYPVLTLAFGLASYSATSLLGGNGFLGTYVSGMVLANRDLIHKQSLVRFHDGVAWLMQITMFLTLGLLVFPSQLVPVIGEGLLASLFLMFVARPIAVFLTLVPTRFTWQEKLLASWVGLRGAVPIVLATFPVVAGVEDAAQVFHMVFFIVLTSALLQGTTLVPVARWLGLEEPEPESPPFDPAAFGPIAGQLRELSVPPDSPAVGRMLVELGLPREVLIVLVFRGDAFVIPRGTTVLEAGDRLMLLAAPEALEEVIRLLRTSPPRPPRAGPRT